MALETGVTYIEDLVTTNPTATDNVDEGDDHLRNIKTAVQGSFPSLGSAAVTKTAAEINALASTTYATDADAVIAADIDARFRGISVSSAGGIRVSSGSFSVVRQGVGTYRITHSKGDSNYAITATVQASATTILVASFANEGATTFDISISDAADTLTDADFHVTMIGW